MILYTNLHVNKHVYMFFYYRYVSQDVGLHVVHEEFLGFVEADTGTTVAALAVNFMETLVDLGIETAKMRGQGYDGAASRKGGIRGVQARIKQIIPGAEYTHCRAHCPNLCLVHACELPEMRNMISTVQQISFSFNLCAKKLLTVKENLEMDPHAQDELHQRAKIQTLCETRWASRAEALSTFKAAFTTVVSALD